MASSDEDSVSRRVRQRQYDAITVLWPRSSNRAPGPLRADVAARTSAQRNLRSTIQRDIIPRLLLAHAVPLGGDGAGGLLAWPVSAVDILGCVESTADCAVEQDRTGVRECLDQALLWGLPIEQVYIQILGGAAGALGDRWGRDTLDFVRVAIAMGVLQASLREFAQDHQHEAAGLSSSRRILLLPTPGESHSFGSSVVAEVFRHRGWNVDSEFNLGCHEISAILRSEWFDVVGLSLGSERNLQQLSETIRQIHRHSRNRRVGILVGGPVFAKHPEWLTCCGGDAFGSDASHAVEQACRLVGLLAESRG